MEADERSEGARETVEDARQALRREFSNVLAAVIGSLNIVARRHDEDEVTQAMIANALFSCNDLNLVMAKYAAASDRPTSPDSQ